jgi:hypothetical protein
MVTKFLVDRKKAEFNEDERQRRSNRRVAEDWGGTEGIRSGMSDAARLSTANC